MRPRKSRPLARVFITSTVVSAVLISGPLVAANDADSDSTLPVRGFAIGVPSPERVDDFVAFIENELVQNNLNTLVLRVDFKYRYKSHPELRDEDALGKSDVRKIIKACRRGGIRLIPQINLLGHQSWQTELGKLLEVYPEFDETPWIELPQTYQWPNADGLYCKSYCPLHPGVHEVVFALVDELVKVFQADAFHAGLDEVFYIGMDRCPRCGGRDRAELFAGEVTRIRNHLARSNVQLWMWGDRLIDGKTTGIGEWEASMNSTHRAIDLMPKDVVINDWHYERPDPTAPYFAAKGFTVVTCPWRLGDVAAIQIEDMVRWRQGSTPEMRSRFAGVVQTIWSSADDFLDQYFGRVPVVDDEFGGDPVACARTVFEEFNKLAR
ncbi:MAG: family 20 glycosylhydrolase [Acidobacteriota bacterium]|jgi:hypothetical protein